MTIVIERLRGLPVDSLCALIAESEQAGLRFVRRLVEEWGTGANRFDRSGEALFAAWVDGQLVGVCGLNIDPYVADDRIGRLRHLYVRSAFRRRRVGEHLVQKAIEAARGRFELLRLRTTNSSAAQFYEALGFRPAEGATQDATHVMQLVTARPTAQCTRATDPGHVEGNPVFLNHDVFNPNREEVADLKERYRRGAVGDVDVKQKLATALNTFLDPIRERRGRFAAKMGLVRDALADGTDRARKAAQTTMALVHEALDLGYLEKFRGL